MRGHLKTRTNLDEFLRMFLSYLNLGRNEKLTLVHHAKVDARHKEGKVKSDIS